MSYRVGLKVIRVPVDNIIDNSNGDRCNMGKLSLIYAK